LILANYCEKVGFDIELDARCIVTTSWDDGNVLDIRLAELLQKFGLKGTFYVPIHYSRRSLRDDEVKFLSKSFEIGAHTLTHPKLTDLSYERAKAEIEGSKAALERILGRRVLGFCYPFGDHNESIIQLVKDAGYAYARTTVVLCTQIENPYRMGTTIYAFPHHFLKDLRSRLQIMGVAAFKGMYDFATRAKLLFDYTYKNGGVWHLWGHSLTIEQYNLWEKLEETFKHISERDDVHYLTNYEALGQLQTYASTAN
jgi:peptidoglycan/xylan/chitin deacetylase (PgdA/CDA1 family)